MRTKDVHAAVEAMLGELGGSVVGQGCAGIECFGQVAAVRAGCPRTIPAGVVPRRFRSKPYGPLRSRWPARSAAAPSAMEDGPSMRSSRTPTPRAPGQGL